MTMNLSDHDRRLFDLEVALGALSRSLAESGQLPLVREAARRTRVEGAKGAAELLEGARATAAYRR